MFSFSKVCTKIIAILGLSFFLLTTPAFSNELEDGLYAQFDTKKALARFESEMQIRYPNAVSTDSGLMYVVNKEGVGQPPKPGTRLTVHYTGMFKNKKVFDSSVKRNKPFEFNVGMGQVIKGWDIALLTMKKGEKRTLLIPYTLAYGEKGYPGAIPPKSNLIFEVELIDFQ